MLEDCSDSCQHQKMRTHELTCKCEGGLIRMHEACVVACIRREGLDCVYCPVCRYRYSQIKFSLANLLVANAKLLIAPLLVVVVALWYGSYALAVFALFDVFLFPLRPLASCVDLFWDVSLVVRDTTLLNFLALALCTRAIRVGQLYMERGELKKQFIAQLSHVVEDERRGDVREVAVVEDAIVQDPHSICDGEETQHESDGRDKNE